MTTQEQKTAETEVWERCYLHITAKACRHIEHKHTMKGWFGKVVLPRS